MVLLWSLRACCALNVTRTFGPCRNCCGFAVIFSLREGRPGALTSAEALFRRSLDWAGRQGSLSWALRAAISLADLLLAQNRITEALGVIRPVHGMFAEGFDTPDLRRASRILSALGVGSPKQ